MVQKYGVYEPQQIDRIRQSPALLCQIIRGFKSPSGAKAGRPPVPRAVARPDNVLTAL